MIGHPADRGVGPVIAGILAGARICPTSWLTSLPAMYSAAPARSWRQGGVFGGAGIGFAQRRCSSTIVIVGGTSGQDWHNYPFEVRRIPRPGAPGDDPHVSDG